MKKSIFIICSIIAFLSTACKKEKSDEISGKDIKMVVFAPILEKAGSLNTYRISGTILAPRPVDTKELGFVITVPGLSVPQFQPLGSGMKIGYFETTIQVAGTIIKENVEFYLVLASNEYVSSNEFIFIPPTPFDVSVGLPALAFNANNDFTCTLTNNDPNNLTVIEYGVQYITPGFPVEEFPVTTPGNNSTLFPATISIPPATFMTGATYTYAVYFMVKNINTNVVQRFTSVDGTFVGS